MDGDFLVFVAIGFLAQMVDGALGMAFGVIASSSLLAFGAPPAVASAAIHAAECATTGVSGASHLWHRNVNYALFRRLAVAGVAGGVTGAYLLAEVIPESVTRPLVTAYLIAMAVLIFARLLDRLPHRRPVPPAPLGVAGGFLDAIGGGGWGPIVASTLLAGGGKPRHTIGTVNLAEFFVTVSISVTFLTTLDLGAYGTIVLGLLVGGVIAAPLAGLLVRRLPAPLALALVGIVLASLCAYNVARLMS